MHLRHMIGAKEECDPLIRWTAVVWLAISTGTNNPQKWWCWLTSLTTRSLLTTFVMTLVEAWQLPHGYLHIRESGGVVELCMHACMLISPNAMAHLTSLWADVCINVQELPYCAHASWELPEAWKFKTQIKLGQSHWTLTKKCPAYSTTSAVPPQSHLICNHLEWSGIVCLFPPQVPLHSQCSSPYPNNSDRVWLYTLMVETLEASSMLHFGIHVHQATPHEHIWCKTTMNDLPVIMLAVFNWAHKLPHTIHDQNKTEHGRTLAFLFQFFEIFYCLLRFPSLEIWGKPFNPWWKCSILQALVALQPPQLPPMGFPSPGVNPVSCVLETGKKLHSPTTSWSAMLFLRILADHTSIITTNKAMALSTRQLWQDSYSLAFFNLQSHHHKESEKNFDMSFSLQPPGTALCFKKLLQVQQWPPPISHNSTSNVLNSWWGRYAHPEVKTTHHQFQYVSAHASLNRWKKPMSSYIDEKPIAFASIGLSFALSLSSISLWSTDLELILRVRLWMTRILPALPVLLWPTLLTWIPFPFDDSFASHHGLFSSSVCPSLLFQLSPFL